MKRKRSLSLLLVAVLCMSTLAGGVCTVKATDEESTESTDRKPVNLLTECTAEGSTWFDDQIEIDTDTDNTYVKVQIGDEEPKTYPSGDKIDLSQIDSNTAVTFEIQTSYIVKYGRWNSEEDEDPEYPIGKRDLVEGDFFTVLIPEGLKLPDGFSEKEELLTKDQTHIADVTYSEKNITYTFTDTVESTELYNITFTAGLELTLDKSALTEESKIITLDIPGNTHEIILPAKTSDAPEKITKTGTYNSDNHTVTWTIAVDPANRSLAGYTLTDFFDNTYQELVSVSWADKELYKYNYDNKTVETGGNISVSTSDNGTADTGDTAGSADDTSAESDGTTTISYTFGDSDKTSDGKFIVVTRLTDQAEAELLKAAGPGTGTATGTDTETETETDTGTETETETNTETETKTETSSDKTVLKLSNTVNLIPPEGSEESKPLNDTASVDVTRSGQSVISKACEQVSADVLRWTITVNPDKARIWKAVVTDVLAADPAKLELVEGTVKVYQDDDKKTGEQSVNKFTTDDEDSELFYTYTKGKDNTEDAGTTDASAGDTLAVTFANGFLANKTYILTFDTRIASNNEYKSGESNASSQEIKFENNASIECFFPDGSGIESMKWESGTIEMKAAEIKLLKECTRFDKTTGMITWVLKPSYGNTAFGTATITDYVGLFTDSDGNRENNGGCQQTLDEETANVCVQSGTDDVSSSLYKVTIEDNVLTIKFKGETYNGDDFKQEDGSVTDSREYLEPEDLNKISVTYQTHADGWGVTADEQGGAANQVYYNTAVLKIDNKTPVSVNASTTQKNDMITKSAASYYDNGESGFRYTIKVNNDKMELDGALLTDNLSELAKNLTYIKDSETVTDPDPEAKLALAGVTVEAGDETVETITFDADGNNSNNNGDVTYSYTGTKNQLGTLTLTLDNLVKEKKQVTVTIDVEIVNSQALFLEGYTLYAENTASVNTTSGDRSGTFTASGGGESEGKIVNKRVAKTSKKNDSDKTITYTIQINPWAADMGKVTLTDVLSDENVEYDDESFKLYEGSNDGTGKLTYSEGSKVEKDDGWSVSFMDNGDGTKQAEITIEECKQPYILTYTVMVLDGAKSSIGNKVTLFSNGTELDSASCSVYVGNWGSASATTVDSITVEKKYYNEITKECEPLAGATFGLFKSESAEKPAKTALTNAKGTAVFRGLKAGTKYWVKELEAPAGYAVTDEVKEITTRTKTEITNKEKLEDMTWECRDERLTANIGFTKTDGNNHRSLSGAGFLMYYEEEGGTTWQAVTEAAGEAGVYTFTGFAALGAGDVAGIATVGDNTETDGTDAALITSANDGSVQVTGLPWEDGTYYLVETETPEGYQTDTTKKYKFTVRLSNDENNPVQTEYDTTSSDGCFAEETSNGVTSYRIENQLIAAEIRLHKADEDKNAVGGVEFDLYKLENMSDEEIKNLTLADLRDSEQAARIVQGLTTDENGNWKSSGAGEAEYEDSTGNMRKVSEGLTAGWYCFVETAVPSGVIKSTELSCFCVKQEISDGVGKTVIRDAEGAVLENGVLTITNGRITAYLRRVQNDSDGKESLLPKDNDAENGLTLTLYVEQDGEWVEVVSFQPDGDNSETSNEEAYSCSIGKYLQTGRSYKLVETQPHSDTVYMKAGDCYFTVDGKGNLYQTAEDGTATEDGDASLANGMLVMKSSAATMSIQNYKTNGGTFTYTLTEEGEAGEEKSITDGKTLNDESENTKTTIAEDSTSSETATRGAYSLRRNTNYTLTITYCPSGVSTDGNGGYVTTVTVFCDESGQLRLAGNENVVFDDNTISVYGFVELTVKKVAATGVLAGKEIPGAGLVLLEGGAQVPTVSDGEKAAVDWQWTTDGYRLLSSGKSAEELIQAGANVINVESDGKTVCYVYENPGNNLNPRTGYLVGFTEGTVYTLRETASPSGYEKAEDVQFSFKDGKITLLRGGDYAEVSGDGTTITMKDSLSKTTSDGGSSGGGGAYDEAGEETPAAEDQDPDSSGKDSTEEANEESPTAETPAAEAEAEDSAGSSKGDGAKKAGAEASAAEDDTKKQGRYVKTGDQTPIALYGILSAAALGIFTLLTLLLRRRKNSRRT